MQSIYIPLGDKQEALQSDLGRALNDVIDHFMLTESDQKAILEILDDNNITFEE